MQRLRGAVVSLLVFAAFVACGGSDRPANMGSPRVIAAFYPLQFVAEQVGGDAVDVAGLTPSGVEPHDLELSARQIRDLGEADVVFYIGEGFQPALEDALGGLDESVRFDALEGQDLTKDFEDEHAEEEHEEDHEESGTDPHVWLDPTRLAAIAAELADRLGELDPDNARLFDRNAADLSEELRRLDQEYSDGLGDCPSREFVTSHSAFGYLAARYDLEQVSISGIDPEGEPSPRRLAEVADFVEEHDVSTIFFEELAPPNVAETLARETGAITDVLSPLESTPEEGDYLTVMSSNLDRLRSALDCG